jgi:23S rRNA pseudouridine1911/1915/1917 synthase
VLAPELAGMRLDMALAAASSLSRRRTRALAEAGRVWLNQAATRVLSRTVTTGDVLDLVLGDDLSLTPPDPPQGLSLLHDDAHLVAVNKPAGLATQSPRERAPGERTVEEVVLMQLGWREGRRPTLAVTHRLDRLTTGVLVMARSHTATSALAAAWSAGRVAKRYLALVVGDPGVEVVTVDAPIGPDPLAPGRFRVSPRGRPATSEVQRLATTEGLSLVEIRPLTGRTHQVRVHLAHLGFPVAGDTRYGGGRSMPRPFLHAWVLTLPHPESRATLVIVAPLPADMKELLATRGLQEPALP